jgi:hypothetical protein
MRLFFIFILVVSTKYLQAQYAPQVNLVGHTAIYKDSAIIINWADSCVVQRGWQNIADTTLGKANAGIASNALGKADVNTCSLGDKGEVHYYFANPITNLAGADFAIFENGFVNTGNDSLAFLELAVVGVSTDGINYAWFDAVSNTDVGTQISGFGANTNASNLNNIAGKYIGSYGTPFDLSDITNSNGVDVNNTKFITIKDVCGSITDGYGTKDFNNNFINDPYPTPFASGGFDIDALGIIHQQNATLVSNLSMNTEVKLFPNPANNFITLKIFETLKHNEIIISDMSGRMYSCSSTLKNNEIVIDVSKLVAGMYILKCGAWISRFTKY